MTETLEQYGLLLLFGIVALQAMGAAGLPGKTALVTAAVLAAGGTFAIWHVVAVAAVAATVGGYVGYAIGRSGGRRLVERTPVRARLAKPLQLMERFFETHGSKAVFLARFVPGLKVVAAPAAGIARMPVAPFAVWHALGAIGFAVLFGLSGYYLGRGAIELVDLLGLYALVPLVGLGVLAWLVFAFVRRRRARVNAASLS